MGNTCLGFGFRGGLGTDDGADLMQVRIHIGVDKILPSTYILSLPLLCSYRVTDAVLEKDKTWISDFCRGT